MQQRYLMLLVTGLLKQFPQSTKATVTIVGGSNGQEVRPSNYADCLRFDAARFRLGAALDLVVTFSIHCPADSS